VKHSPWIILAFAMAGEGSSWSDVLIEEELIAHQWLRRFVIAAPIATAPLFLVPLHFWLANAPLGIFLKCLYVFLIIMTEWSYLKASFTSPGSIPSNWVRFKAIICPYFHPLAQPSKSQFLTLFALC
jgi:hypothetical protein